MAVRTGSAVWEGYLEGGSGTVKVGSAFTAPYSFSSRFDDGGGTNPEELIGAAHAACFSMALAHRLSQAGHPPIRIETTAKVHLEKERSGGGWQIPRIELETHGEVPGIDDDRFLELAEEAKNTCPVSRLLAGAEISLNAKMLAVRTD